MRGNNVMKGYYRRPRGDRRGLPRRLVPHRRPGGDAPGRLHRAARPQEGHHHLRRREHLHDRGRAGAWPATRPCWKCAVVAIPDEHWGEVPKAFVTLKPGTSPTEDELIAFCRTQLAHFKRPRQSSSASCRRPPPARSRSSSCATGSGPGRRSGSTDEGGRGGRPSGSPLLTATSLSVASIRPDDAPRY